VRSGSAGAKAAASTDLGILALRSSLKTSRCDAQLYGVSSYHTDLCPVVLARLRVLLVDCRDSSTSMELFTK
jgi:hypothetical protein